MSIRAFPFVLLAALASVSTFHAARAAESGAMAPAVTQDTAAIKPAAAGSAGVPTPSRGVTKTRTKSNNSNDAVAPPPVEPSNRPGDVKIKTKSNIKND